jgi:recombinational DNA repair protein RecR
VTLLEHDTRQHLRQLVSQARRNRALELDLEAGTKHCAGCQTPTHHYTNGCRTCNDRRRNRKRQST